METYQSPFTTRYGSLKMKSLFSVENKYRQWRRCWVALANAQKDVGYPITQAQIDQLQANMDNLNLEVALAYEEKTHHDVMAQLLAYGDQCPLAKPIIHLGATSAYVSDNGEMLTFLEAGNILYQQLKTIILNLAEFSLKHADTAIMGYTHYQPAQPTTLGKRMATFIQEWMMDIEQLKTLLDTTPILGVKGTTGTQASFYQLFDYDAKKVEQLEQAVAAYLGVSKTIALSGQTYTRKIDSLWLQTLSNIAQTAHKFAIEIRLAQHDQLLAEPFGKDQVGSSAMAYKQNPILSEKINGLSRYVMIQALNGPMTAANQWFERTLDDSSNRRIVLPESFLAVDEILSSVSKIVDGLVVNHAMIDKQLATQLPFYATEPILMACVSKGFDRQVWHEKLRQVSLIVKAELASGASENRLIDYLVAIDDFPLTKQECLDLMDIHRFIGLAKEQTETYIASIQAQLKENAHD